jgi:hypothetical protein
MSDNVEAVLALVDWKLQADALAVHVKATWTPMEAIADQLKARDHKDGSPREDRKLPDVSRHTYVLSDGVWCTHDGYLAETLIANALTKLITQEQSNIDGTVARLLREGD